MKVDKKDSSCEASEVRLECEERVADDSDTSDNEAASLVINSAGDVNVTPNGKSPPYSPVKIVRKSGYLEPSQQGFIQKPKTTTKKMKFTFNDEHRAFEREKQQESRVDPFQFSKMKHHAASNMKSPELEHDRVLMSSPSTYKSNHSISELLKPKTPLDLAADKIPFSHAGVIQFDNSALKKLPALIDRFGRRQKDPHDLLTDDLNRSYDGMPASIQDCGYNRHDIIPPQYRRRAHTPISSTSAGFPRSLIQNGSLSGGGYAQGKLTCRSAGSTPLSSPGAFVDKGMFFPRETYPYHGSSEFDNGVHASDSHKEMHHDFDGLRSVSQCSSPSKSVLKKQSDDEMERYAHAEYISLRV